MTFTWVKGVEPDDAGWNPDIPTGAVCFVCGKSYGAHIGSKCPKDAAPTVRAVVGPRKIKPQLPVEVYSEKKFDAEAAWKAVQDLSKGN